MRAAWLSKRRAEFELDEIVDLGARLVGLSGKREALVIIEASGAGTAIPFATLEALGLGDGACGDMFGLACVDGSAECGNSSRISAALRAHFAGRGDRSGEAHAVERFRTTPMPSFGDSWFITTFG